MSIIASVSTAWCPPSVCSMICAAVGASITIPLLNATRNPTSGGRGGFIWSALYQVFSLSWARSTWCSRFDSDGIKCVTFPLNPIRSMTQLQFVEKLALQLMTNSIGESSEDGEEASSSAAAEPKPFDFAMQQKQTRCKSCGARSTIQCANCEETYCAVYWTSENKKRARESNQALEQARKRGCIAKHAATCKLTAHGDDGKKSGKKPNRRHTTQ